MLTWVVHLRYPLVSPAHWWNGFLAFRCLSGVPFCRFCCTLSCWLVSHSIGILPGFGLFFPDFVMVISIFILLWVALIIYVKLMGCFSADPST